MKITEFILVLFATATMALFTFTFLYVIYRIVTAVAVGFASRVEAGKLAVRNAMAVEFEADRKKLADQTAELNKLRLEREWQQQQLDQAIANFKRAYNIPTPRVTVVDGKRLS